MGHSHYLDRAIIRIGLMKAQFGRTGMHVRLDGLFKVVDGCRSRTATPFVDPPALLAAG